MRNQDPVILNCFTQGGSNILWNVIVSHERVSSPLTETHSCFLSGLNNGMGKGRRPLRWIRVNRSGLLLLVLTRQPRFFDVRNICPRSPISPLARDIIDAELYRWKLKSYRDPVFKYKSRNALYNLEEIRASRLCTKGNNGLIFLNDTFRAMYPSARFIGLARHPVPLFESWKRRRHVQSPEEFSTYYNTLAGRMLEERERHDDFLLCRFEDLLRTPRGVAEDVYRFVGLEFDAGMGIRLKDKGHFRKDGSYGGALQTGSHHWFSFAELPSFLNADVNRLQTDALERDESERILELTRDVRDRLGYNVVGRQ